MSYDTIYHFIRYTIITIYWAFMKESESEVLCTDFTALQLHYPPTTRRIVPWEQYTRQEASIARSYFMHIRNSAI
jgi:hypothetical protein